MHPVTEATTATGTARRLPQVDPLRCTGCGRCVAICGPHLLSLEVVHFRKRSVLQGDEACTGCAQCAVVCPFNAIRMHPAPRQAGPGGNRSG